MPALKFVPDWFVINEILENLDNFVFFNDDTDLDDIDSDIADCNWTLTRNHLVHKRRLNHLAKLANVASLAKWLSVSL